MHDPAATSRDDPRQHSAQVAIATDRGAAVPADGAAVGEVGLPLNSLLSFMPADGAAVGEVGLPLNSSLSFMLGGESCFVF